MKIRSFLCFAVAAMVGAVGCSQSLDDQYVSGREQEIEIHPFANIETKAPVTGTTFPTGRSMVVASKYYQADGGSDANFFSGVTFSKSGTYWKATNKYWPLSGSLDFLAYSCESLSPSATWGSTVTDQVTLSVGNNSSTQDDILFAYAAPTARVSSVSMNFKHAQAQITFKAKSNVAYNGTTNVGITITDIQLNNAYYSGTCVISKAGSCSWSSLGSQTNKSVPGFPSTDLSTSYSGQLGTGILVPEQGCTTATITYTLHNGVGVNNTGLKKTVTLTSSDSNTWVEGKNYCYQLNITEYEIEINPVVTDWTSSPETINVP